MKTGFTLGKFAPLHKGHQYLIETALSEVDHLTVIIYDSPEVIEIPLSIRVQWIQKLYPSIEVIEAYQAPQVIGDTPEIHKLHEDYLDKLIGDRIFDSFYSSEFYGDHISKHFHCMDRRVDSNRSHVQISGTKVRENPYLHRNFLDKFVYKDFVNNIVFMGGPSTGKTTLSKELSKIYNTQWMKEYGSEYWFLHQKDHRLTIEDLETIADRHIQIEDDLIYESNRYLFTDTNALTTLLFALYYGFHPSQKLKTLADLCINRYSTYIICDVDIPYEDTWDRSGNASREILQKMSIEELERRKIPFHLVSGDLADRISKVIKILTL